MLCKEISKVAEGDKHYSVGSNERERMNPCDSSNIQSPADSEQHIKLRIVRHFQRRKIPLSNSYGYGATPAPEAVMLIACSDKNTNCVASVIIMTEAADLFCRMNSIPTKLL